MTCHVARPLSLMVPLLALVSVGYGANPFLPLWEYVPDGEPHVFADPDRPGRSRVYLYGSHDTRQTEYCGYDQVVWSAPVEDLRRWRFDGVAFRSFADANGAPLRKDGRGDVLYAPDVAETTGPDGRKTYWLYPNNQARGRLGMVARADRPEGPFTVCNWSADDPTRTEGALGFDPAVFVDADGRVYGYWCLRGHAYAAELDPATMATVKPSTEVVTDVVGARGQPGDFNFYEAASMRRIKDKYVFVYSRWTKAGEFGLPASNYTLAYAYGDRPLGPFTYGGTLVDGRGRATGADGTAIVTATPNGNTHGSLCEIGGRWWLFYHRQCGLDEYSRQAMVAPVTVSVTEGPGGKVEIGEADYTSEGFETDGLDPLEPHAAGLACHYTGPRPAREDNHRFLFSGAYPVPYRCDGYVHRDAYSPAASRCRVTQVTDGSTLGYRYFNFDRLAGRPADLVLRLRPLGVAGTVGIWLKAPAAADGGVKVGSLSLPAGVRAEADRELAVPLTLPPELCGRQAVYFTFAASVPELPLCELESFVFRTHPLPVID